VLLAVLAGLTLAGLAWRDTFGPPVVRRTSVALAGLPASEEPVRIALISDIHVAGPDMPPERLARIVARISALEPDIVLIAGDLRGDSRFATQHYDPEEAIAPLGALEAPHGVYVALGNHDHGAKLPGIVRALERHGATLLVNRAVQAGPLVVGGLDDAHIGLDDVPGTVRQMDRLRGGRVLLSHSPDAFPKVPDDVSLTVAGHTHCGQVGWPWGGAPITMSRHGQRYACGRVDEGRKVLVTTAGLGTSGLPLRLFARSDIWLIEAWPAGEMD
jgi:predicted MPP superfamily phosphohydrolase